MFDVEVQWASSSDGHIAYAVFGSKQPDLLSVIGLNTHLWMERDEPVKARLTERLATFCRVIHFDQRGCGLSDPISPHQLPALEDRAADVFAVMDDARSEQAVLFADAEGGPVAILCAARHPDRVRGLVLWGTYARLSAAEDYPIGIPPAAFDEWDRSLRTGYADRELRRKMELLINPSMIEHPGMIDRWMDLVYDAARPAQNRALVALARESDVRQILQLVSVPTLVLHRSGDRFIPVRFGRYLGQQIPGARYVELEGADHSSYLGDRETWLEAVEEFVTGQAATRRAVDRLLMTVLFTDIVGSTERAAVLGDRRWSELVDVHDGMVRRQITRFGGNVVRTTGDGFVATFDGPARAIHCAQAVRDGAHRLGLEIRAGVHTGEVHLLGMGLAGIAVHLAARISAMAKAAEILVSGTVKGLVAGSDLVFEDRGMHRLKGIPDEWQVLAVVE